MEVPPEITFRGVNKTDDIEQLILDKIDKLDKLCDHIISCRVAVESNQEHQQAGNPFRVRINLRLPPGKDLVVTRESGQGNVREWLSTVLRDAFSALERQMKKEVDKQQGQVKSHPKQMDLVGYVVRVFPDKGYGFIRTVEGRELYFHQNSVLHGDFDRLEVGTGVRYFPEDGNEGPQASSVQIVDKPGVRAAKTEEDAVEPPQGWKE